MTSWRDVVTVHAAADLFPMMGDEELRALGEDIKKHGLKSAITWFRPQDGDAPYTLLDGRNRLDVMEAVGMTTVENSRVTVYAHFCDETRGVNPYDYVVSANLHRRHLTAEQKRELIAKLLKADPKRSDRATAKIAKVSHVTVGAVRADLEGRGHIDHVATRTDSKGRQQPATKLSVETGRLAPAEAKELRMARPAILMQLSGLLKLDPGNAIEDLARAMRDARSQIAALPKEKRVAAARAYLRALALVDADLRRVGG